MEHKTVKPKVDKMNCGKYLNLYIKRYEKTNDNHLACERKISEKKVSLLDPKIEKPCTDKCTRYQKQRCILNTERKGETKP